MSEKRGAVRHIPNILTLLNLSCGFLALYFIALGEWSTICWLIGIAGLADLLDGLVARALKVSSPIGAQLDSLADMISFGLVPGMILFTLLILPKGGDDFHISAHQPEYFWLALPALLFPICSALRLARFNTEDDSSGDFRGLSTPAATAAVIGFLMVSMIDRDTSFYNYSPSRLEIYSICIVLSFLMVSNIGMFSLKFKGRGWKGNELRYIFIILVILMAILNPKGAILAIMLLYILTNTILHFYSKLTT